MSDTALLDDAVAHAARAVSREHYVNHPILCRVPQATAQSAIERATCGEPGSSQARPSWKLVPAPA
ncbi:MAG: hypothetical protein JO272_12500 [Pseudonocardiales bacterium]|nr:hypothetical protein [Pseudonocardiales bacterium]